VFRKPLLVVALAVVVLAVACGGDDHVGHGTAGGRTVDIDMRDNDFSPASVNVKAGETIQFVFHNMGTVRHDAFIGDQAAQMAHEQDMRVESGMGHGGHENDVITVEPGQTGTLSHTFDSSGTTIIGCHEAGHYALGMKINVNVT
jgi:uncharacterized cupredoxin-like copper-binding protein